MRKTSISFFLMSMAMAAAASAQSTASDTASSPRSLPNNEDSVVTREAAQRGSPSALSGPDAMRSGDIPDVPMECRTASVHCPVNNSSGPSVTSTDSLPLGSTTGIERGAGGPVESQYPTSPGSGSMGSGATGAPTGPAPGPTIGIGR